jgi:uncharacterized membrane protein
MSDITLFNDSGSQMSVMALGKAINWNSKTTLIVSEKEAEILLKYDHVKKYDDISSDGGERIRILEEENKSLKAEIESFKAKAKESNIKIAKNTKIEELVKTEELSKIIEGK